MKICPKCKVLLDWVLADPKGWHDEHLICPKCDGTYNIEEIKNTYMETKIVNLNKEPYDVYIGRSGRGTDGYFGNPHPVYNPSKSWTFCKICNCEHKKGEAIAAFRKDFLIRIEEDAEFRRRVSELRGKKLGCFCDGICHGDVYKEWLDSDEKPLEKIIK